jgi:hypothetical protein
METTGRVDHHILDGERLGLLLYPVEYLNTPVGLELDLSRLLKLNLDSVSALPVQHNGLACKPVSERIAGQGAAIRSTHAGEVPQR